MPTQLQGTVITTPSSSGANMSQSQPGNAGNQFGQRTRFIGALRSGPCYCSIQCNSSTNISHIQVDQEDAITIGHLELDSHADTAYIGADCRIIAYTEQVCQVTPFHPEYEPIKDVPIVQAATDYTNAETGNTFILIINETLHMGESLKSSYLNPNQMQCHGVVVDNVPRHLMQDPSAATHSIYILSADLRIPLCLDGIISYIPTNYPSIQEIETCEWVELTSSKPWNPKSEQFAKDEEQMIQSLNTIHPTYDQNIATYTIQSVLHHKFRTWNQPYNQVHI